MNIQDLLESGNVTLAVSAADLREFGLCLIAEANASKNEPQQEEKYLTTDEVCEILHVSSNTLWRWNKTGYLNSVKVGRTPMYKQSDIDNLRGGRS